MSRRHIIHENTRKIRSELGIIFKKYTQSLDKDSKNNADGAIITFPT